MSSAKRKGLIWTTIVLIATAIISANNSEAIKAQVNKVKSMLKK